MHVQILKPFSELMEEITELREKNKRLNEELAATSQQMVTNETALQQEKQNSSELDRGEADSESEKIGKATHPY